MAIDYSKVHAYNPEVTDDASWSERAQAPEVFRRNWPDILAVLLLAAEAILLFCCLDSLYVGIVRPVLVGVGWLLEGIGAIAPVAAGCAFGWKKLFRR